MQKWMHTSSQVASAALKRDQHMIAVGLRLPPRFVCTQSASRTQVQALKKGYSRDTYEDDLDISHTAVPHEAAYSSRMILPKVRPEVTHANASPAIIVQTCTQIILLPLQYLFIIKFLLSFGLYCI